MSLLLPFTDINAGKLSAGTNVRQGIGSDTIRR